MLIKIMFQYNNDNSQIQFTFIKKFQTFFYANKKKLRSYYNCSYYYGFGWFIIYFTSLLVISYLTKVRFKNALFFNIIVLLRTNFKEKY